MARLFADAGMVAIVPLISPYRADRDRARAGPRGRRPAASSRSSSTPRIEECERRDPKGLYVKARAGELKGFTGIDDPYEAPESPELVLATATTTVHEAAALVVARLDATG